MRTIGIKRAMNPLKMDLSKPERGMLLRLSREGIKMVRQSSDQEGVSQVALRTKRFEHDGLLWIYDTQGKPGTAAFAKGNSLAEAVRNLIQKVKGNTLVEDYSRKVHRA